ncbi:hypothetical protein ACI2UK_26250 [Ralstonia nicotianae]|uniref:hypothetical protein n=1 Tax=Ralstonia pseudosolanacearum TaxID=1310165 RepID=UPI0020031E29|nr:hypothetical protein [Ralstonia pseudosolanacearum]MCK4120464.1 hypothetical protein [Ralstonia pseudosolanacearum]
MQLRDLFQHLPGQKERSLRHCADESLVAPSCIPIACCLPLLRAEHETKWSLSRQERPVPFSSLAKDRISVIKQSGERFDDLRASVQANRVFLFGTEPLVEAGDTVLCFRSNGAEEAYRVLDPNFREGHGGIPPGYQMHVEKLNVTRVNYIAKRD